MAAIDTPFPVARPRYSGILEWVTTVDHKKIGVLYLWTTFFFFLTGGLMALAVRAQTGTGCGCSAADASWDTMVLLGLLVTLHRRPTWWRRTRSRSRGAPPSRASERMLVEVRARRGSPLPAEAKAGPALRA